MIRKKQLQEDVNKTNEKLRELQFDIGAAIVHVRNIPGVDRMSNKEMLDALLNEFTKEK
jgi:hypothetical protein